MHQKIEVILNSNAFKWYWSDIMNYVATHSSESTGKPSHQSRKSEFFVEVWALCPPVKMPSILILPREVVLQILSLLPTSDLVSAGEAFTLTHQDSAGLQAPGQGHHQQLQAQWLGAGPSSWSGHYRTRASNELLLFVKIWSLIGTDAKSCQSLVTFPLPWL